MKVLRSMIDKAAVAAAGLALLLTACASVPTEFYTLVPPAQQQQSASAGFQIEVQPADMPPQVSTQQIVVRTGAGEMVPVDTRRWIAPLGDEIRAALSAGLSQRLGVRDVYGLPNASQAPGTVTWRIDVKVQRFESALGAYARIDALWTLRRAGEGAVAASCGSSVMETVQPGYPALVEGHQRALAELAGRIAAALSTAQQAGGPVCPQGL